MRRLAPARLHCDGTALQFGLGDDFLPDGVFGLPASGRRFQTKRRDPAHWLRRSASSASRIEPRLEAANVGSGRFGPCEERFHGRRPALPPSRKAGGLVSLIPTERRLGAIPIKTIDREPMPDTGNHPLERGVPALAAARGSVRTDSPAQ